MHTEIARSSLPLGKPLAPQSPTITPAQCRAARGMLDWTQGVLSDHSKVGIVTIRLFETLKTVPSQRVRLLIQSALEEAGVDFILENGSGPGVRLRKA